MQFSATIITLALATGVFAGVADVNSPATIYQGTCSTITQKCNFKRNGKNAKTTCSSGHQCTISGKHCSYSDQSRITVCS
ncbi:hypothetical protein NHJ13051_009923 [Beauveria bassiana]